MNPEITVVVPVYKVERYLPLCMESLLSQTYKDFEIILVDDGSPDQCPKMCDEYEEEYSNVHVFHKKNAGQSSARNFGVSKAQGKYICFVDSDDSVDSRYLEILMKGIKQTGADISAVDFVEVYDVKQHKPVNDTVIQVNKYSAADALAEILYQKFRDVSACGMLIPKEIVLQNPFPVGRLYEDYFVTYKYFLQVKEVAVIRNPLYFYLIRGDSTMAIRDNRFIKDLMEAADAVIRGCQKNPVLLKAAKCKQFSNYCRLILQPSDLKKKYPNQYRRIVTTLKEERMAVLRDKNARMKNRLAALALLGGISGLKLAFKLSGK